MKIIAEIIASGSKDADCQICLSFDEGGADFLIGKLESLKRDGVFEHEHLMTEAWAGWELSEERQHPDAVLCNHVVLYYLPQAKADAG